MTLAGIEAHVCVAQTALELMGMGFQVRIPADASSEGVNPGTVRQNSSCA